MPVFFSDEDRVLYLDILDSVAARCGIKLWAYCLMGNHVHHVAVPQTTDSLARTFGIAHSKYASEINRREGWNGHLWQERFYSFPMDDRHAYNSCRYVLRNPVRAGLTELAEEWPYSSASAHLGRTPPLDLLDLRALDGQVSDWNRFLRQPAPPEELEAIRGCSRSGLPWGSSAFVERLERELDRPLRPAAMGRPPTRPSN